MADTGAACFLGITGDNRINKTVYDCTARPYPDQLTRARGLIPRSSKRAINSGSRRNARASSFCSFLPLRLSWDFTELTTTDDSCIIHLRRYTPFHDDRAARRSLCVIASAIGGNRLSANRIPLISDFLF